ncbi:Glycoside hydrolase family 20 [Trypanosoma melophagium]|uniref:Glycoside hydrolase family 20 n=1 Tax=Trypanosoma melophagium TaxID=715481 RepID=UPI00351AAB86|nr:Glycoside hydrolase family 20 [Trypanosoma melophagium]
MIKGAAIPRFKGTPGDPGPGGTRPHSTIQKNKGTTAATPENATPGPPAFQRWRGSPGKNPTHDGSPAEAPTECPRRVGEKRPGRVTFFGALCAARAVHAAFPPVWPMPQNYTNGTETVVIDGANMRLFSKCGSSEKLTSSFDRFVKRTFTHRRGELGEGVRAVSVVAVCVRNVSVPLQLGVSEAYRLSASVDGIMVECEEIYGCYHGLETLSQLISFNYSSRQYELHHAPWRVDDFPRFSHRGVLVDTSRHFYPVPVLKQIIDSLTYAKLNVLHWHITDAHSFPMESKKCPQLAEHGAFSPAERFSIKDMEEVRDYAMARVFLSFFFFWWFFEFCQRE